MVWIELINEAQLAEVKRLSTKQPVVIFKHSTRCEISNMAKGRLERATTPQGITFFYLDLLRHRALSNTIATDFQVAHASPQVLLIRDGHCVYDESHNGINMEEISELAAA